MPTVSYKGGAPGVVRVVDEQTLAFPNYDGNGMFLSIGNIDENHKIGMLFIDLETPNRVRVQATASVAQDDDLLDAWPGANLVVRAHVEKVFHNCGRYIHKHQRIETSRYVPGPDGEIPYPAWKRIDMVQDVLVPKDQGQAEHEGGVITFNDYIEKLQAGNS